MELRPLKPIAWRLKKLLPAIPVLPKRRRRRRRGFDNGSERLEIRALLTVTFEPVADLNTQADGDSSHPSDFVHAEGYSFFQATTASLGRELWRTDGTDAGTWNVADVAPGPMSSNLQDVTVAGQYVFFRASYHRDRPDQLWRASGTSPSAEPVVWSSQGEVVSSPQILAYFDGSLFFVAGHTSGSTRLYRLDAQPGSYPEEVLASAGTYSATSDHYGVVTSDALFIAAGNSSHRILHVVRPGDYAVSSIGVFRSLDGMFARDDRVFFSARPYTLPGEPQEAAAIWISDGTEIGTQQLDLPSGTVRSSLTWINDTKFYFLREGDEQQWELWSTDGTPQGAAFEFEVERVATSVSVPVIVSSRDSIYFIAFDEIGATQLWRTDGTQAGTVPLTDPQDLRPQPAGRLTEWNGGVLFRAFVPGDSTANYYLIDDGSFIPVVLPVDTAPGTGPVEMVPFPGTERVFFRIWTSDRKAELWSTDGSASITLVRDLNVATNSSHPFGLVRRGSEIFFSAQSNSGGGPASEIARSDGTSQGTRITGRETHDFRVTSDGRIFLVDPNSGEVFTLAPGSNDWILTKDIEPGSAYAHIELLDTVGKRVLFNANPSDGRRGLWVSDGSSAGTLPLIAPDGTQLGRHGVGSWIRMRDNFIVFEHILAGGGREIWGTDGTAQGTRKILSVTAAGFSANDLQFTVVQGRVAFFLSNSSVGRMLWITDGTAEGTLLVRNPTPLWNVATSVQWLSRDSDVAYFALVGSDGWIDLWKTDGTSGGTDRLGRIREHHTAPRLTSSITIDDRLYFVLEKDFESVLWTADGTPDGTKTILRGLLGERRDASVHLYSEFGRLFFLADDQVHGRRLWISDGTSSGTRMLRNTDGDLPPFMVRDGAADLTGMNGKLYYPGTTDEFGEELVRLSSDTLEGVPGRLRILRDLEPLVTSEPLVTWREVFGAEGYEIEITDLQDNLKPATIIRVASSSWRPGPDYLSGIYRLRVRGVRHDGSIGEWSSETLDFTLADRPHVLPMTALTVVHPPLISWINPDAAARSEIWISNLYSQERVAYSIINGTDVQFLSTDLPPAKYAVWIRSLGDNGRSEWSDVAVFTILAAAPQIVGITENSSRGLNINWTAVAGADDYEVFIQKAGSGAAYRLLSGLGAVTSVQTDNFLPGDRYTVWVRAWRVGRPHSNWSAASSLLIRQTPEPKWSSGKLSWNAIGQATGYEFVLRHTLTGLILNSGITVNPEVLPDPALPPGQYAFVVRTLYADGQASTWISLSFEEFHPVVKITPSLQPTVDATPVIQWQQQAEEARFEVYVGLNGQSAPIYRQTQIRGTNHRIDPPLPPNHYRVWVRVHFPDGSRSSWGSGDLLSIGDRPVTNAEGRTFSWTPVRDATHYEIQIQRWNPVTQAYQNYLINERVLQTTVTLDASSSGTFRAWVRALRNEAGDTYKSLWSVVLIFDVV